MPPVSQNWCGMVAQVGGGGGGGGSGGGGGGTRGGRGAGGGRLCARAGGGCRDCDGGGSARRGRQAQVAQPEPQQEPVPLPEPVQALPLPLPQQVRYGRDHAPACFGPLVVCCAHLRGGRSASRGLCSSGNAMPRSRACPCHLACPMWSSLIPPGADPRLACVCLVQGAARRRRPLRRLRAPALLRWRPPAAARAGLAPGRLGVPLLPLPQLCQPRPVLQVR